MEASVPFDSLRSDSLRLHPVPAVGEALLMHARILALDSATSGLDASTAFHVCAWICAYSRHTGATAVLVLQQPTVETFELFEDVILLAEVSSTTSPLDSATASDTVAPTVHCALKY